MSKPITRLVVSSCRGATSTLELDFDPKKCLTMLFGENGSGKTSILDSIDIALNGGKGSLEGISVGQSASQYIPSLGAESSALRLNVFSGAESWTVTNEGIKQTPKVPEEQPAVKVLRRNNLLKLVLAQPKQRYEVLEKFIDIGTVAASEACLKRAVQEARDNLEETLKRRVTHEENLDQLWKAEGSLDGNSLDWAKGKVELGIDALELHLESLTSLSETLGRVEDCRIKILEENEGLKAKEKALVEVQKKILEASEIRADYTFKLLDSLKKARTYIESDREIAKCPTCLRPMERQNLLNIVNSQLEDLTTASGLSGELNKVQKAKETQDTKRTEAIEELNSSLRESDLVIEKAPDEVKRYLKMPPRTWQETERLDDLISYAECLTEFKEQITEDRDRVRIDVAQFNAINQGYRSLEEAVQQSENQDRIHKGLKELCSIVYGERVRFVQGVLDGIAQEANRLYQEIHPGEELGLGELTMKEGMMGSVNQSAHFHGYSDLPPQAIFSDSHLDTLGFCVWLALAKKDSPESTILLIDDIFSSVDAVHLGRIIDLLRAEGGKFLQVIIATHFRLWWDRCQGAPDIQRIHLGTWSLGNGISVQYQPLFTEELNRLVNEPVLDRQAVSSKAGILLESVLDRLALVYGRPLPRKKTGYTLGELLDSCGKLFSNYKLTVQRNTNWNSGINEEIWQEADPTTVFNTIKNLRFIRNQVGAHFNEPGTEIPDREVRSFGQATVALVEALTCPGCGNLGFKVSNDGTHLRCSCKKKTIKMTPVKT